MAIAGLNVSRCVSVRNSFPAGSDLRSTSSPKPNEQRWPDNFIQHRWRCSRSVAGGFRFAAIDRFSIEFDLIRGGLRRACNPGERKRELVFPPAVCIRIACAWRSLCPNRRGLSLSARGNAFRKCPSPVRSGWLPFTEKNRRHGRYPSVAAPRSFRPTLLLPAGHERLLDVRYAAAQPALHAIVCLSAAGASTRKRKCAADLLRRGHDR